MKLPLTCVTVVCVCFLVSPFVQHVSAQLELRLKAQRTLDTLLSGTYDKRVRPTHFNESETSAAPTIDWVNIFVRSIEEVNTERQEMRVQVTFRQNWNDGRLQYDPTSSGNHVAFLTLDDPSRIWMPDLFFSSGSAGHRHTLMSPNSLVRIYPNGNVLYSIRVSVTISCPMDLRFFPHDRQVCSIKMASYGYTTEDLILYWKNSNPLQINADLRGSEFRLVGTRTEFLSSRTNTGEYSALTAQFELMRQFSPYLRQVYVPVLFFLLISYLGLWLQRQDHRLLVTLAATLCLALFIAQASLPKTGYTKSIDLWTGVSLAVAFLNLVVVALSSYLPEQAPPDDSDKSPEEGTQDALAEKKPVQHLEVVRKALAQVTKSRFEFAARATIPITFALFVFVYFLTQALVSRRSLIGPMTEYGRR